MKNVPDLIAYKYFQLIFAFCIYNYLDNWRGKVEKKVKINVKIIFYFGLGNIR